MITYPRSTNYCSCQKSFAGKLILLILETGRVGNFLCNAMASNGYKNQNIIAFFKM